MIAPRTRAAGTERRPSSTVAGPTRPAGAVQSTRTASQPGGAEGVKHRRQGYSTAADDLLVRPFEHLGVLVDSLLK